MHTHTTPQQTLLYNALHLAVVFQYIQGEIIELDLINFIFSARTKKNSFS